MKQNEIDRVLASVEREVARQNTEMREAIGDDAALLAQWKSVLEFAPVRRARPVPAVHWAGMTRA